MKAEGYRRCNNQRQSFELTAVPLPSLDWKERASSLRTAATWANCAGSSSAMERLSNKRSSARFLREPALNRKAANDQRISLELARRLEAH